MLARGRIALALSSTILLLPFLYGYFFFVAVYVAVSPFFLALAVAGLLFVGFLSRRIPQSRGEWIARRLPSMLGLAWLAGCALALRALAEPVMNPAVLWLGYSAGSFWYPYLAWLGFRKDCRPNRRRVLASLVVLQILFLLVFRIDGATGQDLFIVNWRASVAPSRAYAVYSSDSPKKPNADADYSFPQYLGPNRDATLTGPKLGRDWAKTPPQLCWRRPVGAGWGGFAIVSGSAVTQEQRPAGESVVSYDLPTGAERWVHSDPVAFTKSMAGPGPRSTPSIVGTRVYTLGATGLLNCLELETGRVIWRQDVTKDNGAGEDDNGMSSSPLVDQYAIRVCPTGKKWTLVGFDVASGSLMQRVGSYRASYSSPAEVSVDGSAQILVFHSSGIAGFSGSSSKRLWNFPWDEGGNHCMQPLFRETPAGLEVFASANKAGALMLRVRKEGTRWQAEQVWANIALKTKFSSVVRRGEYIYGLDDGILTCLEWNTGRRLWKEGRYGHGQLLLVDDLLLIVTEQGELALVEPTPDRRLELGRIQAIVGKTWNTLALAGSMLLVRNSEEAACYELPTTD